MRGSQLVGLSLLLIATCGGCRTLEQGISSSDRHATVALSKRADSQLERVYIKDSIVYRDSLVERWHIRDRDRWHRQSDTLIRRDTVVSRQVVTQTTNRLSPWQRSQITCLWIVLALLAAWALWRIRGVWR